jgi:hypothetical protein
MKRHAILTPPQISIIELHHPTTIILTIIIARQASERKGVVETIRLPASTIAQAVKVL